MEHITFSNKNGAGTDVDSQPERAQALDRCSPHVVARYRLAACSTERIGVWCARLVPSFVIDTDTRSKAACWKPSTNA
jgi:hypothetical protein